MAPSRTDRPSPLLSRGTKPTALVDSFLAGIVSANTRASYAKGIDDLYTFAAGRPVTLNLLHDWRMALMASRATSTVNLRVTAVRRFIKFLGSSGRIDDREATRLASIESIPFRGTRMGNWLTAAQTRRLLTVPSRKNLRGIRNYCILAILAGCALRVGELAALDLETIQQRDGRWVLADLPGKGGRIRTVAIPGWVKQAIDAWLKASKIKEGLVIRQLTLSPDGLSKQGLWDIVRKAAQKIGVQNFGPHDLRRTCARLCRENGGDLEQIQIMLGHESLVTTQRYLGTVQNLRNAVNDNLGL